jgi:glycerol-3-phosphate dehydrogenase subunit B
VTAARIVVIGAGVAGASAALAAREGRHEVLVIDGGSGASTLAPGALDGDADHAGSALPFDGFALGACRIATMAGMIRRAAGRDLALLDLDATGDGMIAVPTSVHHGWDARVLAAQWNDGDSAFSGRFVALDATLLRFTDERDLPDADLARRHDDPARLAWLAERLREALATGKTSGQRISAVLLPPWLGAGSPRAATLSALLEIPAGEALAANLGPSGLRFEAARDRAFAEQGVQVRGSRAKAVRRASAEATPFVIELADGETIEARAVVLANGGLVGGGLRYTPSASDLAFAVPTRSRATMELGVTVDPHLATVGLDGRPLIAPGSLFGASPEQLAWPFQRPAPIERAGVLPPTHDGVYVAGELAADLPRTWLAAVRSGQRAGQAASARLLDPRRSGST